MRACARASPWAHSATLKRSNWQTAARGCQHSTLISPWWIEWKMCLILFFLLLPALINLQQHWNQYRYCTFPLYWISTHALFWQERHSTIPHHRYVVIFKYVSAHMFCRQFKIYGIFLLCTLACENYLSDFSRLRSAVFVLQIVIRQVWYSARQEVVIHITVLFANFSAEV